MLTIDFNLRKIKPFHGKIGVFLLVYKSIDTVYLNYSQLHTVYCR